MDGKMVIFSAPSGSGKTTIVRRLLDAGLPLEFSISAASRMPRNNEKDGVDYYFLSPEEFRKKIDNEEFVEWEEVYHNQYYGTLNTEIDRIWKNGRHIIFDVDVVGGVNIKKKFGSKALAVFIMPPSVEILEQRLRDRGTENEDSLAKRIKKAAWEIEYATRFDVRVINDDLETAVDEAYNLVAEFLKQ